MTFIFFSCFLLPFYIIKVASLEAGDYKITIDGNVLTKTYTAEELAQGVNIAIDENNPAQIQSKLAYDATVKKIKKRRI